MKIYKQSLQYLKKISNNSLKNSLYFIPSLKYHTYDRFSKLKIPHSQQNYLFQYQPQSFLFNAFKNKITETQINDLNVEYEKKFEEFRDPPQLLELLENLIQQKINYYQKEQYPQFIKDLLKKSVLLNSLKRNEEKDELIDFILQQDENESDDVIYDKVDAILIKTSVVTNESQLQKNMELVQKAQKLLEKPENGLKSQHMALCNQQLASIHFNLGNIQGSADEMEKSIMIYEYLLEKASDQQQYDDVIYPYSGVLQQLGIFHTDLRNKEMAIKYLTHALKLWERMDEGNDILSIDHIRTINEMGTCFCTFQDFQQGYSYQVKAFDEIKKLEPLQPHLHETYTQIILGLAKTNFDFGQIEQSLKYTDIAEEFARKNELNYYLLLQILEHKSTVLQSFNELEQSFLIIEEALNIITENNILQDPLYSRFLYNRGLILIQNELYEEALQTSQIGYENSCGIFGPEDEQAAVQLKHIGECHFNIGLKANDQKLIDKGLDELREAANLLQDNEARSQDYLKVLDILMKFLRKMKIYEQSIHYAEKLQERSQEFYKAIQFDPEDIKRINDYYDQQIKEMKKEMQENIKKE